ncbi:hypothetical protein [Paractinoplanes toevensis]|uniref:Branched chain amino acid aminotransferase n=1 Tax=Paractinoplanes toevensis TaxID=571911 RepID=A0A919WBE6_9ACTN|nr:hypothetical protein [Actinoplanes toevensis]GIM97022.1 branched chain amino acid aminotransferase [Actinoplanes toevensis]
MEKLPKVLMLWAAPRSRSTAFFRMMCERGDFSVLHEPFSYLAEFGRVEVAEREVRDGTALLAALRELGERGPLFVKDTTDERYPEVLADTAFLATDAKHTMIIRHPAATIASYHALNPDVRRHQIGVEAQYEIFKAVWDATGEPPVVVDSDDLIADPAATVRAYCAQLGIPFRAEALAWQPANRPEWKPSERWHADAGASQGFHRTEKAYDVDVAAHPVLREYLAHHLPFYEKLHAHRVQP